MRYFKRLSLKFSDPKMEEQFAFVKDQRINQDFYMVVSFLLTMHTLIVVPNLINENYIDVYIVLIPIATLLISLLMRKKWQKYIQQLTLIGLFSFNCSRLVSMIFSYPGKVEARTYFVGYSYGVIQTVVLLLIHKLPYKIAGCAASYALRMGIILGAVDGRAFDALLLIRHFVVDAFTLYTFYSIEKTERKVFQDYYENREELVKFKELLQDSLPQSVAIIDCNTQASLFSNNCFKSIFENDKVETDRCKTDQGLINLDRQHTETNKPNINYLLVDLTTIREVGTLQSEFKADDWFEGRPYLDQTIKKLVMYNLLYENRVISLTASHLGHGQPRLFEIILKRIKWDRTDAIAIILNDITDRENITSLKVANQTKDTIIATISHELRTPLHGIIGLMENTAKKAEDSEISKYLSLCKSNMYLLWSLVNSLLDFHHISTGNLRLNLGRTNVRKVLKEIVKLFQFQADLKKIILDLNVNQDVPYYIITDKDRLKQILVTLVSNAIKFTFYGGIKIEVTQDSDEMDCLKISVADTGIGIKNEDREKLFKIQEKQENQTNVRKNGVGLNLTIANNLAGALNKNINKKVIKVKSEEGVGSLFYFKIMTNLQSDHIITSRSLPKTGKTSRRSNQQDDEKNEQDPLRNELHIANIGNILFRRKTLQSRETIQNLANDDEDSMSSECLEESETLIDIESKLATYTTLKRVSTLGFKSGAKANTFEDPVKHPQKVSNFSPYTKERGSQDYLELPKSSDSRAPLQTHSHEGYVLIVDDTPLNLLVAENLIKSLGYSIKTALSGHEAIRVMQKCAVERQLVKVILMDCQMPVMDGYETTQVLKDMMEKQEIQNTPIIAWTANNGDEDIKRCYEAGMVAHLTKPTPKETLLKALSDLTE